MTYTIATLTKEGWPNQLNKILPKELHTMPMKDTLEYMLDPSSDDLNPGYTAPDEDLHNAAQITYDESKAGGYDFCLKYMSNEDHSLRKVQLTAILNSIPDILHEEESNSDPYTSMHLTMTGHVIGGNYNTQ